jgi:hypothetical protein
MEESDITETVGNYGHYVPYMGLNVHDKSCDFTTLSSYSCSFQNEYSLLKIVHDSNL